ncbi:MAG: DUF6754 domain-containing protein [Planctomycetota bacterium]
MKIKFFLMLFQICILLISCAPQLPHERQEKLILPSKFKAIDAPNDDGSAVMLVWSVSPSENIKDKVIENEIKEKTRKALKKETTENTKDALIEEISKRVRKEVETSYKSHPEVKYVISMSKTKDGEFAKTAEIKSNSSYASENPKYFGHSNNNLMLHFLEITKPFKELKEKEAELTKIIVDSNTLIETIQFAINGNQENLLSFIKEKEEKYKVLSLQLREAKGKEKEQLQKKCEAFRTDMNRYQQISEFAKRQNNSAGEEKITELKEKVLKTREEREEIRQQLNNEDDLTYYFKLEMTDGKETLIYPEIVSAYPIPNYFNWARFNHFVLMLLFSIIVMFFIGYAKRNPNLFIRKINGLDAVDEAVGRATEMGKPIFYFTGLGTMGELPTIASTNILGRVARKIAQHDSQIKVPCTDPIVMSVCQEVVKEAYTAVGRPDAFREENVFFVSNEQFSFTAAADGMMIREKPATNFFLGYFFAESLLLTETGAGTGAIQIAGTDALHQLPFFITTCDYTLIGEELYAASAYLSHEPVLMGSLKGQDAGKLFLLVLVVIGVILSSIGVDYLMRLLEPL